MTDQTSSSNMDSKLPDTDRKSQDVKADRRGDDLAAVEIDHHAEAVLLRKLDLFIIPITMLLYLLSFLDRVNIGNAR